MAYKVFTNGSVLNASEVNDNLMNQAVITFTNSTARASAITSPVEGMVTYLADTDTYQFWNGSAWTNLVSSTVGTGNAIINGAFEINQRNFSSSTSTGFNFDRWQSYISGGTVTTSSQAFTLGTAPVSGYEGKTFYRAVTSGQSAASDAANLSTRIESVRTFAGQTVTISFFAKAGSGTPKVAVELAQEYGSGGSPSTSSFTLAGSPTLSTAWTRYSLTVAVPSIAGKTLGTSHDGALGLVFWFSAGTDFNARTGSLGIQSNTFDIWGVQVEAGSTATPFRRNANSLQGELAACQRYYWRTTSNSSSSTDTFSNIGFGFSSTQAVVQFACPVEMRAKPTSIDFANLQTMTNTFGQSNVSALTINAGNNKIIEATSTSGSISSGTILQVRSNGSAVGFVGFSAEL